jgi:hypothetical protein
MYTVVSYLSEVCARKKRYRYIAQISSKKLMIYQVLGAAAPAPSCMPMTPIYPHINFALTSKCSLNKKWCCNYNYDTVIIIMILLQQQKNFHEFVS